CCVLFSGLGALLPLLSFPTRRSSDLALGLLRAGPLGALAAWAAFTLPSALILVLFAYSAAAFAGPVGLGLLHGLKIVAVAVVAQDRKSTRLNSSHVKISYAVFCLKKK